MPVRRLRAVLVLLLALPAAAWAGCSRTMLVPVSPLGITVTVDGHGGVGGVFPDMLRAAGNAAGCEFNWLVAPRARIEAMFEAGQSDILLAASRSPKRDLVGTYVPMVGTRATLISIDPKRAPVHSLAELLKRKELRVALVRGYDFGEAYQVLVQKLGEQNRLILEASSSKVARLIHEGIADVTVMTSVGMAGAITTDERLKGMMEKLRVEPLEEIPWSDTGVYISKATVSAEDRELLEKIIATITKKKTLWDAYRRHYPANVLADGIRLP
jgi:polar amino acid transport system substrate-binding protein